MDKVRAFVKRYQLISFFLLTYLITWGLWIPFVGPAVRGSTFADILAIWGIFGPALAGILISRLITSGDDDIGRKKPIGFFCLGLILSAIILVLYISTSSGLSWTFERMIGPFVISLLVAIPPAYVLSSAFSRNHAIRDYLRSLIKPRGPAIYYLIAVFLPPLMYWLGTLLSGTLGQGSYYTPPPLTGWDALRVISITFLYQFFYGNVLGEEVGWRGFALPRLQARYSPFVASLIIALAWFPWHLPLKWANPDVIPYLYYALSFIPSSVLLTWIYNRTDGSILAVGIAHVMGNVSGKLLFPITNSRLFIGFVVAIILIVVDRMWEKLPGADSLFLLPGQVQGTAIPPSNSA